jgi:hypothetical protein
MKSLLGQNKDIVDLWALAVAAVEKNVVPQVEATPEEKKEEVSVVEEEVAVVEPVVNDEKEEVKAE